MVSGTAFVPGLTGLVRTGFNAVVQYWWTLPLSVSVVSLLALGIQSSLAGMSQKRPNTSPTPAYLVSGPSLAALNLVSLLSLEPSPPPWVEAIMLMLLCLSAWVYYRGVKRSDGES